MNWDSVVHLWGEIEATSLRNTKTEVLSQIWRQASPEEARKLCYLIMGRVAPLYQPIELGMAEKSLLRVVAWASKVPLEEVTSEYKRIGDLGQVVEKLRASSFELSGKPEIGIAEVHEKLLKIAMMSGKGSQEAKVVAMGELLSLLSPAGAKYVMRLVSGKLRLGLMDMTIIDSLSWASSGNKQDRPNLEHAYNVSSDLGLVAATYLASPDKLVNWRVTPGVPVRPMRAERLGTISEIVEKLGECAVEPKLDGMRVQIHAFENKASSLELLASSKKQEGLFAGEEESKVKVKIFSRGLEDITAMFPEVVSAATTLYQDIGEFVLDGEAIGVDSSGKYLPFQETMTRKRKYGIEAQVKDKPLKVVVFDMLYGRGEDRLASTYVERRSLLETNLHNSSVFVLAESEKVTTPKRMQELFDQAMKKGLEGILVKKLDSVYRAGARDSAWVKYKRAHESDLSDTIDAVVIGAYVGKGKRNKFGVGAFLVGVSQDEKIVTVAKIGTGLTDEQFGELYGKLKVYQVKSLPAQAGSSSEYDVPKALTPDIWVTPAIVVEIEADEITESPLHTAGYALRFPRLLRFREDKTVSDITTVAEVRQLFEIGRGR